MTNGRLTCQPAGWQSPFANIVRSRRERRGERHQGNIAWRDRGLVQWHVSATTTTAAAVTPGGPQAVGLATTAMPRGIQHGTLSYRSCPSSGSLSVSFSTSSWMSQAVFARLGVWCWPVRSGFFGACSNARRGTMDYIWPTFDVQVDGRLLQAVCIRASVARNADSLSRHVAIQMSPLRPMAPFVGSRCSFGGHAKPTNPHATTCCSS